MVRQFSFDLAVDGSKLFRVVRKEGASAGLFRQPSQDELCLVRPFHARHLTSGQPDRVDGDVGAGGKVQHFVEPDEARRILAI